MPYTVYALASLKKTYIYVGMTNNLERRTKEHNRGLNRTTKPYLPFRLIYQRSFVERVQARSHEKKMKSGYEREHLKKLVGCSGTL